MDWVTLGSGVLALPVVGLLLYCIVPRLLQCWHLRRVTLPPGLRTSIPVRFPAYPDIEPTSPQELLPSVGPTFAVGSFLNAPASPAPSRRTSGHA